MSLKIKPDHLSHLINTMQPLDTEFYRSRYIAAGLSDMRYRWDLLRHAGLMTWLCDNLYPYLNDTHINNALKSFTKPLKTPSEPLSPSPQGDSGINP